MDKHDTSEPTSIKTADIVRDTTFARFVADEGIVVPIGRDLEVMFLQYGPELVSKVDMGDTEQANFRQVTTEVARMRIGQGEFLGMVMNFIRMGIFDKRLKGEGLQKSIAEWTVAASAQTVQTEGSE